MDQARRRRIGIVALLGVMFVFGAFAVGAASVHHAAAALEFAMTGLIVATAGLIALAVRPNPEGPWWNRPVRINTRRRLVAVGAYMVLMLFLVLFFTARLFGPGTAALETAVLGLLTIAAFAIGWRRIGTS